MPGRFVISITRRVFIFFTLIMCMIFLLASLAPYLNPANWWLIGFLGLIVPYLVILLIFAFIFWLIMKPIIALFPLLSLLVGWKQLSVVFATHPMATFTAEKPDSNFRVVSWNVGSMYGLTNNNYKRKHHRTEIAEAILRLKPDVICLQEFNHSYTQGPDADNIGLFSKEYPYHYFPKDYNKNNGFYTYGNIIFSKTPIIDSGRIKYSENVMESLIYADIIKHTDTLRMYTSHLQSFKFTSGDYADMEKIKQQNEQSLAASKNIFEKMKLAFTRRGNQAEIVRKVIDESPFASVMCGDFNDVPNSFTYFHIRGLRQDAFLKQGFGIGRTFISMAPTLRIDYILPDNNFIVQQFDMVDEDLSDHLMLVTDLSIKK